MIEPSQGDSRTRQPQPPVRVTIWDERQPEQKLAYDGYLGDAVATHLQTRPGFAVRSVGLDDPGQGLTDDVLESSDVLVWWGHRRHDEVAPETAGRIVDRIQAGNLSLVALHSAHWSTPFVRAMNERTAQDALVGLPADQRKNAKLTFVHPRRGAPTLGDPLTPSAERKSLPGGRIELVLRLPWCAFPAWRNDGRPGHLTTLLPDHPIAAGLPTHWTIPQTEMYAEPFHVPEPDAVIFEERWDAGERFRSGCLWSVGVGKVFYFRPGHETYPIYRQVEPLRVIENACRWLPSATRPAAAVMRFKL